MQKMAGVRRMKIPKSKKLNSFIILLLLIVVLVQVAESKSLFRQRNDINKQVELVKEKNIFLKKKLWDLRKNKNKKSFKERYSTANIIEKSKAFNLELIDFSSSKTELNLNLYGKFHSILSFFNYLEEIENIKIIEFKLKSERKSLFLFIKLRKELI